MSFQLTIVLAILFCASCYLSWRGWRAWKRAAQGCTGGCGCASATPPPAIPKETIVPISCERLKLRNNP